MNAEAEHAVARPLNRPGASLVLLYQSNQSGPTSEM